MLAPMAEKFNAGTFGTKLTGGAKINKFIAKAKASKASGVKSIKVGFFEKAKYPDGTPVASVASWNEFGTKTTAGKQIIPERPFFRNAIPKMKERIVDITVKRVPADLHVSKQDARLMGSACKGILQTEIRDLNQPPNAPRTIERKGSSNPLIADGFMRISVTYEISKDES